MRLVQCFSLLIAFSFTGCTCVFRPCERRVHVSGHVFDPEHKPLAHSTVIFAGNRKETDENGCFYFGEAPAAGPFEITVNKLGYKPYSAIKESDFYEIVVTVASESSEQQSTALWHKLYVDELASYRTCAGTK